MRFFLLFIPYFLALSFSDDPVGSFSIAWGGSFWIFWLSISGKIKSLPTDLKVADQFMRPLILTQLVFAGYMAVTSVFYFLDIQGYVFFEKSLSFSPNLNRIRIASVCQQYYSLAHACLVTGILLFESRRTKQKKVYSLTRFDPIFLLQLTAFFSLFALVTSFIPGLQQLYSRFQHLTLIASILAFSISLGKRDMVFILIGGALFAFNLLSAFLSGWKEAVLVPLIILSVLVYPFYKKQVLIIAIPFFFFLLYFLPSYNQIVRTQSWYEGVEAEDAAGDALSKLGEGTVDIEENNWEFLTLRLSEIYMFSRFVERVPSDHDFYGLEIVGQAVGALLPRIIYPDKPNIEPLVMERVYEAGIVTRGTLVSAKPPPVVDAYISGGAFGIIVTFLLIGLLASFASQEAERLFGGYLPGTALIYTGLFQVFWRGNCFEFMLGTIFWSFIVMYLFFFVGRQLGYVTRVK